MNVTDPVLWVGEALLNSEVELMENLTDEQGAVRGRLQDGGEELRKVRLQEAGALLNNIRLCLLTVQTCTPIKTKNPGKMQSKWPLQTIKRQKGVINLFFFCLTLPLSVLLYLGPILHISFLQRFGLLLGPEACADIAFQQPAVRERRQRCLCVQLPITTLWKLLE